MKRIAALFVAVVLLLVLVGCEVMPGISPLETPVLPGGGGGDVDVPTLPAFLEILASPTGWVILGALFSSLLARAAWYNTLSADVKRGLILVSSVLAAVGARLLLTYMPPLFWEATAAYWYIVGGVVMTWLGSQGWYRAVVKPAELAEKTKKALADAETGI
ncbi:MAG: hypothetical protein JXR84_13555 [Anaerolineae bacterium]|nr:hypothetical protein [Anaerolineae bacterium]